MVPKKRKAKSGESPAKPTKQQKLGSTKYIELSASNEDEPLFRRGGASVLSPFEQKQIQIRAKKYAFYEQETGGRLGPTSGSDADERINSNAVAGFGSGVLFSRHKPVSKVSKKHKGIDSPQNGVKIEGLSYTRLAPGSIVLGQVSKINRYDISLSLPNNLTGYIPLTSVSDKVIEKVKKSLDGSSSEGEEESSESHRLERQVDLHSLFFVGQFLRAFVTSTHANTSSGAAGKRHIKLSINPRKANVGITVKELVVNSTVQAEVLSVEDHGLIMNLGHDGELPKAFMSSRDLGTLKSSLDIRPGAVLLCLVIGFSPNSKIVKLSADPQRLGNLKKTNYLIDAPTVDIFLPGTAVEVLVTKSSSSGLIGKIMGLVDVTSDVVHSRAPGTSIHLEKQYPVGSKVKARIICTFPTAVEKKLGISLLNHVMSLSASDQMTLMKQPNPSNVVPISTIMDEVKVIQVEPGYGLFVQSEGLHGFVHVSRISDEKIESLHADTGPYKVGSIHRGRVTGYSFMDGRFLLSFEQSILKQAFLAIEDVQLGQVISGVVERLVFNSGSITGMLVQIAENITGFVPEMHLADVRLQHPEQKYKEGSKVRARVLSIDLEKRQVRLTLKKSLVNSEISIWKSFQDIVPGMEALGTIIKVVDSGASVQFYGAVRGFLPISQMSESYIQDPTQHFHAGQVVKVHVLSVNAIEQRMIVSCIGASLFGPTQEHALQQLALGSIVRGDVCAKTNTECLVELEGARLKAELLFDHLMDGSAQICLSAAKRIKVGQTLQEIAVLSKNSSKRSIEVTSKPSLIKAFQLGIMPKSFEEIKVGAEVTGYVKSVTPTGIFIRFAGYVTGLLPVGQLSDDRVKLPGFGFHINETTNTRVMSVDLDKKRFLLTKRSPFPQSENDGSLPSPLKVEKPLVDPVDGISISMSDFALGKITKAKIMSVKETQLNVKLANNVQGRVDVSAIFDSWEDIKDRKHPLKTFAAKQLISVRVLGIHDSRNHRYLPITNVGKAPVFELTAKPKDLDHLENMSINKIHIGSTWLCFVNNIVDDCLWVNLSPNVRGRISTLDASDSAAVLSDISKKFPIGSALRARVLDVDLMNNRLDLCIRSSPRSLDDLSEGMIVPAKVTKVTEGQVFVQLSDRLSAAIHLVDMEDDFSKTSPSAYQKNQIISVYVVNVDSKKIVLSTRPSRLLSLSLPIRDPEISSFSQLYVNKVMRGFVKNITDNGVFISLAHNLTALVRVSDLSDLFIKDWKPQFHVNQLVEGRVIALDPILHHIQMSLKKSVLQEDYKAPLLYSSIHVGQIVTGKVRKVEDFGVFVVLDNSANVSGLCHRSEMADEPVKNVKDLYKEGDKVKAKILKVDSEQRRISLSLRTTAYLELQDNHPEHSEEDSDVNDASVDSEDKFMKDREPEGYHAKCSNFQDIDNHQKPIYDDHTTNTNSVSQQDTISGLTVGAFSWAESVADGKAKEWGIVPPSQGEAWTDKKRMKSEILIDETGKLDANGPQSIADFERLLMGLPNSSYLWVSYMAFHLRLNDVSEARRIAERAIRIINHQSADTMPEAVDVWVAFLNLENTYGTKDSLSKVFQQACRFNDAEEMHNRLASIYIQSSQNEVRLWRLTFSKKSFRTTLRFF